MKKNEQERFTELVFYVVIVLLLFTMFRIFEPFLAPLGWAGVMGVLFYSWNKELEKRFGPTAAASLSTVGVALILIAPVLLLSMLFVHEASDAAARVQTAIAAGQFGWFNRAWRRIMEHIAAYSAVDLTSLAEEGAARTGQYLASQLGGIVRNIVFFVFQLFVMLFALFYCFRDGDAIVARLRNLLPFEPSMRDKMLSESRDLIFASITTSLVIAAVQGSICGSAFALAGLGAPVFWGVCMAAFSLVPVVGASPVWITAAVWLFSQGSIGRGLVLIGICGGLGSTIDNILRPILLGGRASLNALLVFISVIGGIAVFGMLGVVLGPIVVATVVGILDVYTKRESAAEPMAPTSSA